MVKHSKTYTDLVNCVEATIDGWRKTQCSEIEQRVHVQELVYGIAKAALYILSYQEYQDFI
jgi:hypothetical protein